MPRAGLALQPFRAKTMRLRLFDLAVTAGTLCLAGYIGWHIFEGPRSFANREALERRIASLELKRDEIATRRVAFERKVTLLRPDSIDPDLLDELSRATLGYGARGDIVMELAPINGR
jgi:cell division protein FtsB